MSRFLHSIQANRYGGLSDFEVGPFKPGLNVVYGPNEAGKSTLTSLVGGVLFGWEDAHGVRNTYRPDTGDRSGRLVWGRILPDDDSDAGGQNTGTIVQATYLERDEESLRGDATVIDDVDAETYHAIFSFTADELRSLGSSSDVTARLLTAVSGTESSPATAFTVVERRTVEAVQDILSLDRQIEDARERMKREAERAELMKQQDRELYDLRAGRVSTAQRVDELNREIENLVAWHADLEALDAREEDCREQLAGLQEERQQLAESADASATVSQRVLELDSATERVLRDKLDELDEQKEKADRMLDVAKENSATSTAAYEALVELDEDGAKEQAAKGRGLSVSLTPQAAVLVLLTVAFIFAGVPLFVHGRDINSLSFTVLGLGLVFCAVLIAVVAVVNALRPSKENEAIETRRKDAQWVMLQDQKKLNACLEESQRQTREIEAFLQERDLGAAHGSIRQARSILDEAREQRSALATHRQRITSIDLRIRSLEQQLDDIVRKRQRIREQAGMARLSVNSVAAHEQSRDDGASDDSNAAFQGFANATDHSFAGPDGAKPSEGEEASRDDSLGVIDALIRSKTAQRDALFETSNDMSEHLGELTQELDRAKGDLSFSLAKFEYHQLRERMRVRKNDLIALLLAKRMLERSIAAWENQSQPEVYEQASSLLAIITAGQWVEVSTSETGSLIAINANGVARDPRHLSLGTCQQLYLALRMALLMTAHDVGGEIPVLADDILVNFDATRRAGAAQAFSELSRARQVIIFTCHEETVGILQAAYPALNRIDLK